MLIVTSTCAIGEATAITSDGKPIGTLGTIIGDQALALCRIDRVKDAVDADNPILAGETPIALTIPPHVTYDWPSEADNV